MKRASKVTYFFSGMLTALLLISMITPALAAGLSKYIEVSTGVSVYVDDVKIDPRDANGNPVDVFIYNGTTYLPVRAISNSLDIPIQWDGKNRSVFVGRHTGDRPAVWLANMDYFAGTSGNSFYTADSQQDNLGEMHYHCISQSFERTYQLNGQYTRMTGTLYQKYGYRSDIVIVECGLNIFADGELIYSQNFYKGDTGIKPINFDIDLSGVLELKVTFAGGSNLGWTDNRMFALGDVGLWT